MSTRFTLLVCTIVSVVANAAHGQFDAVINVPPDISRGSIGSNTQLNVFEGGGVSRGFEAGAYGVSGENIEVNIYGGWVGNHFKAYDGSRVFISGGIFGHEFVAYDGSQVTISGGEFGEEFHAAYGSQVTISGGSLGADYSFKDGSHLTFSGESFASIAIPLKASTALGHPRPLSQGQARC